MKKENEKKKGYWLKIFIIILAIVILMGLLFGSVTSGLDWYLGSWFYDR